eukprot:ANDGO_02506.mRNA.1 hypothetical protein DQ04_09241000
MHRHPLDADGMVGSLFLSLWKKHPETLDSCSGVIVPDTVLYEHGFPRAWLSSDVGMRPTTRPMSAPSSPLSRPVTSPGGRGSPSLSSTGLLHCTTKRERTVETYELKKRQGKEIDPRAVYAAMIKQPSEDLDAVAMYMEKPHENSPTAVVEYLTRKEIGEMFPDPKNSSAGNNRRQRTGYQGIVQKMVYGASNSVSLIQATWSPYLCIVDRRINKNGAEDKRFTPYERAVTHEGPQHHSKSVPCAPPVEDKVRLICECIVRHVQAVENVAIARMVLYFRPDAQNRLYLSWCDSMRLNSADRSREINLSISYQTPEKLAKKKENSTVAVERVIPSLESTVKPATEKKESEPCASCPGCDCQVPVSKLHAAGVAAIIDYYAKLCKPRAFSPAVRTRLAIDTNSPRTPKGSSTRDRSRSVLKGPQSPSSARSGSPTFGNSTSPTHSSGCSPTSFSPVSPFSANTKGTGDDSDPMRGTSPPPFDELAQDVRARRIAQASILNEQRMVCMQVWQEDIWYRIYSHFLVSRNNIKVRIPDIYKSVSMLLKSDENPVTLYQILTRGLARVHIKFESDGNIWEFHYSPNMTIGKWESLVGAVGREMESMLEEREAKFWGVSLDDMKELAAKSVSYVLTEIERRRKEAYLKEAEKRQQEREEEGKKRRRRAGTIMGRTSSSSSIASDFSDDSPPPVPNILKGLFPEAQSVADLVDKKQAGILQADVVSVNVCQQCYLTYNNQGKALILRRSPSVISNHSSM